MTRDLIKILLVDLFDLSAEKICDLIQQYEEYKPGLFKKKKSFLEFMGFNDNISQKDLCKLGVNKDPFDVNLDELRESIRTPLPVGYLREKRLEQIKQKIKDLQEEKEIVELEDGVELSETDNGHMKITVDKKFEWTKIEALDAYCDYDAKALTLGLVNASLKTMVYKWGSHCGDKMTNLFDPKTPSMLLFNGDDIDNQALYNRLENFPLYGLFNSELSIMSIFQTMPSGIEIDTVLVRELYTAIGQLIPTVMMQLSENNDIKRRALNPTAVTIAPINFDIILEGLKQSDTHENGAKWECIQDILPICCAVDNIVLEIMSGEEFDKLLESMSHSYIIDILSTIPNEDITEEWSNINGNNVQNIRFDLSKYGKDNMILSHQVEKSPMILADILQTWQMVIQLYLNDSFIASDRSICENLTDDIVSILKGIFLINRDIFAKLDLPDSIINLICQLSMYLVDEPDGDYSDIFVQELISRVIEIRDQIFKFVYESVTNEGEPPLEHIKNALGLENEVNMKGRDLALEEAAYRIMCVSKRDRNSYCLEYFGDAIYKDNPDDPYSTVLEYFQCLEVIDDYEEISREKLMLLLATYEYARDQIIQKIPEMTYDDVDQLLMDQGYLNHARGLLNNCNHEEEPKVYNKAIATGLRLLKLLTNMAKEPVENPETDNCSGGLKEVTKEDKE